MMRLGHWKINIEKWDIRQNPVGQENPVLSILFMFMSIKINP